MKRLTLSLLVSATTLALSVGLLVRCTSETEDIAPAPANEAAELEQTLEAGAPAAAEAPASDEVIEDTDALQFPKSSSNARTSAYGVTDYVDFNDELALQIIPDQAAYTFASAPFYIQGVGNAWIHVKENNGPGYGSSFTSNYGHYHLSYEKGPICFKSNGEVGTGSPNNCVAVDPVKEPRSVDTHDGSQWIKIYAYDSTRPERVFDLLSIKVTNGPLQLWFKKKSGGWWHWSSLGEGTWNLSAYSTEITQVLIAGTGRSSIGFDNVKVKVPYN